MSHNKSVKSDIRQIGYWLMFNIPEMERTGCYFNVTIVHPLPPLSQGAIEKDSTSLLF